MGWDDVQNIGWWCRTADEVSGLQNAERIRSRALSPTIAGRFKVPCQTLPARERTGFTSRVERTGVRICELAA